MSGKLKIQTTRLREGRKIDTWSYPLPGGDKIDIDIQMHTSKDAIEFTAISRHSLLEKQSWTGSDLQSLREAVERDVTHKVEAFIAADWTPAYCVVTRVDLRHLGTTKGATVNLEFRPVKRENGAQPDNLGRRRIIENGAVSKIIERAASDIFKPLAGGDENSAAAMIMAAELRREEGHSVTLVPEGAGRDLERLQAVLARFGQELQKRLAPGLAGALGVPAADDLIDMMRSAVSGAGQGE